MKKILALCICLAVLINATGFVASAESSGGNSTTIDESLNAENGNGQNDNTEDASVIDNPDNTDEAGIPDNPNNNPDDIDNVPNPDGNAGSGDANDQADTGNPTEPTGNPDTGKDKYAVINPDGNAGSKGEKPDNAKPDNAVDYPDSAKDSHDAKDDGDKNADNPNNDVRKPAAATPAKPPAKKTSTYAEKIKEEKNKICKIIKDKISKKSAKKTEAEVKATPAGNNPALAAVTPVQRVATVQRPQIIEHKVDESLITFIENYIFCKDTTLNNNSIEVRNVILANNTANHGKTQVVTANISSIKGQKNYNVTLAIMHKNAPMELFNQTINGTMRIEKSNTVKVCFNNIKVREDDLIFVIVASPNNIKLYAAEAFKAVFSEYKHDWVLFNLTD